MIPLPDRGHSQNWRMNKQAAIAWLVFCHPSTSPQHLSIKHQRLKHAAAPVFQGLLGGGFEACRSMPQHSKFSWGPLVLAVDGHCLPPHR